MVTILQPPPRQKKLGERFAESVGAIGAELPNFLGQIQGQQNIKKENEALKRFGVDLTDVTDPDIRKTIIQGATKKKQEDTEKFSTGLQTIDAMRQIASKKNIGRGSQILGAFGGETARDRSEFAQLGTSLIPLVAAGVPIRNLREFEQYKKIITNPSSLLSEIEGALNGLERIFNEKLEGKEEKIGSQSKVSRKSEKIKFNAKNPEHLAKRNQLLKAYKGDREKVRQELNREFEE